MISFLFKSPLETDEVEGHHNDVHLQDSSTKRQSTDHHSSQEPSKQHKSSDFFLKTEIHGLPEIYEAESKLWKVFWTVLVIVSTILLIYFLYKVLKEYIDTPIVTSYSLVNRPDGMMFPQVLDLWKAPSWILAIWQLTTVDIF